MKWKMEKQNPKLLQPLLQRHNITGKMSKMKTDKIIMEVLLITRIIVFLDSNAAYDEANQQIKLSQYDSNTTENLQNQQQYQASLTEKKLNNYLQQAKYLMSG